MQSAGGGDDSPSADRRQQSAESGTPDTKAKKAEKAEKAKKAKKDEKDEQAQAKKEEQAPAAPAPADESAPAAPATAVDPARGAALNDQGFALMSGGEYAGAVPVLQQAVASFPQDSQDINYAYALYNLGKALNRSGRPDEAIPYLEKRLTWPDQRETVQIELDDARAKAE